MKKIDLHALLSLPPEKAIKYFISKGYKVTKHWRAIWQEAHTKVFTVAGVMREDILKDIKQLIERALKKGITFQQFKAEFERMLISKGWLSRVTEEVVEKPYRLKTIYQTNLQTAYMAGRYKEQIENVDDRPYLQYVAVLDSRTRPMHSKLHGKVFRYDDKIWDTHYPPNGFNCRCRVRALTGSDVKRRGLTVESSEGKLKQVEVLISKKTGETAMVTSYEGITPDVGWNYNAGKTFWTGK